MLNFRVLLKIVDSAYYFGNAGFVVRSEKSVAIGNYQILPHVVRQFGKFCRRKDYSGSRIEQNVPAVIFLNYARRHVAAGKIRRCVEVRDKTYHRGIGSSVRRQCGHKVAVFIKADFFEAELFEFGFEMFGKEHLSGSRWGKIRKFVALRVELHILQESIY